MTMEKIILSNFDYRDIVHPEDRAIVEKLDSLPGFKNFMMNTICALREKYIAIEYGGNGIHANETCLSDLDNQLKDVCHTLGVEKSTDLSLMWCYGIKADTMGAKHPHITSMSGTIDLLSEEELSFMIGHELGHQICGHKPYHIFLETLYMPTINMVPGGKIWISTVRSTLLDWYRLSDYTADRMGLLACQNLNIALQCMIKMAGIPKKYYNNIDVKSFIKQAHEFDSMFSGISNQLVNYVSVNTACSPWLIARAAKLLEWYDSGKYHYILDKHHGKSRLDM